MEAVGRPCSTEAPLQFSSTEILSGIDSINVGVESPSADKLPMKMNSGGGASTSVFSDSSVIPIGDVSRMESLMEEEKRTEERQNHEEHPVSSSSVRTESVQVFNVVAGEKSPEEDEEEDQYYQKFVAEMKRRQLEERDKRENIVENIVIAAGEGKGQVGKKGRKLYFT